MMKNLLHFASGTRLHLLVGCLVLFQISYLLPSASVLPSGSVTDHLLIPTENREHHHARLAALPSEALPETLKEQAMRAPLQESSNTKIIAISNGFVSYKEMAIAWYHRMTELGYTTHELWATDDGAARAFQRHGLRYRQLELCDFADKKSKPYRLHLFAMRWYYIQKEIQQGYNILLTDVDNYFRSYKPMSDMEQLADIDVVHAYSGNHPRNMYKYRGWGVCGGMIWVRASPGGRHLVDRIVNNCARGEALNTNNFTCAVGCDDQRIINNIYLNNDYNFSYTLGDTHYHELDPDFMREKFWKEPLTGRSAVYNFTTWSVGTAYRGPAMPPNGTCPDNNWVAMPYAGRDRQYAIQSFLETCNDNTAPLKNTDTAVSTNSESAHTIDESESFNVTSHEFSDSRLQCLREVLSHLPVGNGRLPRFRKLDGDKVFAHHYDAANRHLWNAEIRFKPIEQMKQQGCSFWEIGAYTQASDSRQMLKMYPECQFHAYEPIPSYFQELTKNWQDVQGGSMNLHNYGLAAEDSVIQVSAQALHGQATFIGDQKQEQADKGSGMTAQIRSFDFAARDAGGHYPTVLHLNCEGCEWQLLPDLADSGFAQHVPVLQISMHNYGGGGLGNRVWEYCEIREKLQRTHRLVEGIPFAWERWELANPLQALNR